MKPSEEAYIDGISASMVERQRRLQVARDEIVRVYGSAFRTMFVADWRLLQIYDAMEREGRFDE
jgi:hypothetical protein